MDRCRTCEHWDAPAEDRESQFLVNDCKIKMRSFDVSKPGADYYIRGDGCLEYVETEAMFGCVLHRPLFTEEK